MSYLDILLDVHNQQLIWPTVLQPTPLFVHEITTTLESLLQKTINPAHQADAVHRDRALEKEILLGKVCILHQPQASLELQNPPDLTTVVNKQPSITSTLFRPPSRGNQDPRPAVQRLWIPKGIEQHTEKIDYQDSLWKIEAELQALTTEFRPLQTPVT